MERKKKEKRQKVEENVTVARKDLMEKGFQSSEQARILRNYEENDQNETTTTETKGLN